MRARWLSLLPIVAVVLASARARAQEPSDALAELALSEEVFPQERGTLQWRIAAGLRDEDDGLVLEPSIGLELGVLDGLEVRGVLPLEVALESATGGAGRSELGLVWGPLDDPDRGVSLLWNNVLPSRSGVSDTVFEHDVEVIGHLSIDRLHAQLATGIEVQHGDVRAQGRTDAKIDLEVATAIWLHLDRVAIVLEGAGEPEPDEVEWELGPTVLVQAFDPLVLSAHGHATLGDDAPRYEGTIAAIVDDRLFE